MALSVIFLVAAGVGAVYPTHPRTAIVLAVVVGAAAVLWSDASRLAVLAIPGVWLTTRVPGVDVSLTDVLVAAAGAAAVVGAARPLLQPPARLLFGGFAFYLGTLGVSLAANPALRSDIEWFHRIGIVGGGLLTGAWVVRRGKQHIALRALLAATCFMSVVAIIDAATSSFQPAYPLGYHKNFIGSIAATTLLTLMAAASQFRLSRLALGTGALLTAGGLAASQSRAAMLAVVIGGVVWFTFAGREERRRHWRAALLAASVFGAAASWSLVGQVSDNDPHSSLAQRLQVETATRALWENNLFTGVGLRFFDLPAFSGYQPPNNVLNEILAEAGIPGLVGFAVFVVLSLLALRRCTGPLALAAFIVVLARFAHGLVDIYWTAGTTSLAWLVGGMGLANMTPTRKSRAAEGHRDPESLLPEVDELARASEER